MSPIKITIFLFSLIATLTAAKEFGPNFQPHDYTSSKLYKNFRIKAEEIFLPTAVTPEHYDVHIRPILNDPEDPTEEHFTAPGSIKIVLNVHEETSQVTLHKDNMTVLEDSIMVFELTEDGSHGAQIEVVNTVFDETLAFYTVNLTTPLTTGNKYELSMDFITFINEGSNGLYRAQYTTPSGEIRYMATTQFEASAARMAFPCFDEPALKATFDISIARRVERNSLCNTLPIQVGAADPNLPSGYVWDIYNRTVPMSSYLIAMVISDFVCETADSAIFLGRPVRTCGPSYQIEGQKGGIFPAEAAARTMRFIEETFDYPYEMYKVDNIAVPHLYFGPGAMENWGLVTYRDDYVLFFEGESSESSRNGVWSIIFHELAHQWFGNLVTCQTWTNIWLNEGFATFVSSMLNEVDPDFDSTREGLGRTHGAMAYDVSRNEPIYNPVSGSGGAIIYDKGSSVLRMMEGFLSKDVLITGMREYLRRHAYKPVNQDQFFAVINEVAQSYGAVPEGSSIKQIMDTWTLQPKFPLVRVSTVDSNTIHISQETCQSVQDPIADFVWEVPVAMATENNPDFSNHTPAFWLINKSTGQDVQHDTTSWVIVNPDGMAYYRVLYDDNLLALIHARWAENLDNLSGLSRSQLIDDYFTFFELGHEPVEKAVELTKYLENEDDHIVWNSVFRHANKIQDFLGGPEALTAYLLPNVELALDRILLNWTLPLNAVGKGSKVVHTANLLNRACSMGSTKCKTLAASLFVRWMADPAKLTELMPSDFEPTILCHGVAQLSSEAKNFLQEQYDSTDPYSLHKERFRNALSCAQ